LTARALEIGWRDRRVPAHHAPVADDDQARIDQALREATEYVTRMPASPGERELKARLESFRRVLESWGTVHRPTRQQVDALIERVNEVRRLATDTAPTVRRRKVED
jgi:hypothetical protein